MAAAALLLSLDQVVKWLVATNLPRGEVISVTTWFNLVHVVLLWRGICSRLETVGYVGMIGGALGNVVDRLRIGAVVDYLDLHWRDMHWPAFNLADIFVVGSAVLLILASSLPGRAGRRAGQGHST